MHVFWLLLKRPPPCFNEFHAVPVNMKLVTGWQVKERKPDKIRGCSPLSCQEMQEQMAAEAGNKATNALGHQSNTQMFLSFSKSKLL